MTEQPKPRVLFIFEAGPAIGWGHASRCLALADAMSLSSDVGLAVNHAALAMLGARADDVVAVFEDGRPVSVIEALCGDGVAVPNTVVIDHYRIEATAESRLRSRGARVVVIDDLADRRHDCDVLIDSNPARTRDDYCALVPRECQLLLGADYALLRPEFRTARLALETSSRAEGTRLRLLISLGATDPANATGKVLAALSAVEAPLEATIVLGKGAPHADAIAAGLPTLTYAARLLTGVGDMAAHYGAHDLAIGAPSTGALERACVGLPSLLIETADNQRDLAKALHEADAAELLGRRDQVTREDIAGAVDRIAGDASRRNALRAGGLALVDGQGARRAAGNLGRRFTTRDGRPLLGRRLRREDGDVILAWQSVPGARRYSRTPWPPGEAEHRQWIESRLGPTPATTEIIELDGRAAAMARLDSRSGLQEVSILVAPQAQGCGIGEATVRYLEAFRDDVPVVAYVHPDNAASLRLFRNCGFGDGADRRLEMISVASESAVHQ